MRQQIKAYTGFTTREKDILLDKINSGYTKECLIDYAKLYLKLDIKEVILCLN